MTGTKGDISITATMDNSEVKKSAEEITVILDELGIEKFTDLYNRAAKEIAGFTKMRPNEQNTILYGLLTQAKQIPSVVQKPLAEVNKQVNTIQESLTNKVVPSISGSVSKGLILIGASIATAVASIVTSLAATATLILLWGKRMFDDLSNSLFPFSNFYDKMLKLQTAFNGLRAAWLGVFANLLNAAMPVILRITDWLTNMLNKLSMVIAALTGQKTALIGVGVAATHAGNAAKDMLAPFDKINVLQQDNKLMQLKEVPIDPAILEAVDKLKTLWENVRVAAANTWDWITKKWGQFADWFNKNIWKPVSAWFINSVWKPVTDSLQNFWAQIQPKLAELWKNIQRDSKWLWDNVLKPLFQDISTFFQNMDWGSVMSIFRNTWNIIVDIVRFAWAAITGIINIALDLLNGRLDLAFADLKAMGTGMLTSILDIGKSLVNIIISILNFLLSAYVSAVNTLAERYNLIANSIAKALIPGFAGVSVPTMPPIKIPFLASGAVIPPNAAFAAVLGDQKSGRNIETPEALLRQIVAEELSRQTVNINFTGSLAQLAKVLKPEFDKENVRVGNSLVRRTGQVPVS